MGTLRTVDAWRLQGETGVPEGRDIKIYETLSRSCRHFKGTTADENDNEFFRLRLQVNDGHAEASIQRFGNKVHERLGHDRVRILV